MKPLSPFIDKLQATFPPNRICILLAGPIVAAAAWLSAVVTANVPGVELPTGIVAGVIGAAVLIVVTLLYKWFDKWQEGEPIDVSADLESAFEEIVAGHQTIDGLIGTYAGVGTALEALIKDVEAGEVNEAELHARLEQISKSLEVGVAKHAPPEGEIPSSTDAAPPTATE